MSVLLLDAGNTRLKWALSQQGQFLQHGAFAYSWQALPEQFEQQWAAVMTSHPLEKLVLCNVAGERLVSALQRWLDGREASDKAFQETAPLTIEHVTAQAEAFGVKCAYQEPAQLGADRWAALVAARHHIAGACCVIDAGTALTIDVLNADGVHMGGVIAPGMAMMRQGLQVNTAQIETDDAANHSLFSVRNTASAVQAGIMAASVGAVQQVLEQCRQQGLQNPACVVTGGDAQSLLPHLPGRSVLETEWVLKGLAVIAGEHE